MVSDVPLMYGIVAVVVVTVTDNSPFQDYPHPDDHTTRSTSLPGSNPLL